MRDKRLDPHIRYEYEMLRYAHQKLSELETPAYSPLTPLGQQSANIACEQFLLHAWNLYSHLSYKKRMERSEHYHWVIGATQHLFGLLDARFLEEKPDLAPERRRAILLELASFNRKALNATEPKNDDPVPVYLNVPPDMSFVTRRVDRMSPYSE